MTQLTTKRFEKLMDSRETRLYKVTPNQETKNHKYYHVKALHDIFFLVSKL